MPSFLDVVFLVGLPFAGALLANSLTLLVVLLALRKSAMRASD